MMEPALTKYLFWLKKILIKKKLLKLVLQKNYLNLEKKIKNLNFQVFQQSRELVPMEQ